MRAGKKGKTRDRLIAGILSVSMMLSLWCGITMGAEASEGDPKPLYTRAADKNTMDSYVQASLGGFIYTEHGPDGVTSATVRNNYGTRYAGEVWSDLSVFANGQKVAAEIRPFEEGKKYPQKDLDELIAACKTDSQDASAGDINKILDVLGVQAGTALTATQAGYLNDLANGVDVTIGGTTYKGAALSVDYAYTGDGDFNGTELILAEETDGVNSVISMDEYADFLNVFSVLGSSSQTVDGGPFDVVLVLDASASMGNVTNSSSRIRQAVDALNASIKQLMDLHKDNRVAVVVFASRPAVLMELRHYTPVNNDTTTYVTATQNGNGNSDDDKTYYTITANANYIDENGNSALCDTRVRTKYDYYAGNYGRGIFSNGGWSDIGTGTNLDSGLWTAMSLLAQRTDLITTLNGETVVRIPSVVVLSDGAPSFRAATSSVSGNNNYRETDGKWWNMPDLLGSNFAYGGSGSSSDDGIVLSTILRASLMKAAVLKNYQNAAKEADNGKGAANKDSVKVGFYTIGVGLEDLASATRAVARAVMDPGDPTTGFNANNSAVSTAYNSWIDLRNTNTSVTATGKRYHNNNTVDSTITFNPIPTNGVELTFGSNKITLTREDLNAVMDVGYTDRYFSASQATELGGIFETVMTMIAADPYKPVMGTNATNVTDSLTYVNPIGEYMSVDQVTDVTMFGERYQVSRRAVYSYAANAAILESEGKDPLTDPITEGWYSESTNAEGKTVYKFEGAALPRSKTAAQAWADGWVYRIRHTTAQEYVPTLAEVANKADLTEKQQSTVYTIYSITGQYKKDDDGNTSSVTPIDTDTRRGNLSYAVGSEEGTSVSFDLLDDVRIWVEDTGRFQDDTVGDLRFDTNYSEALFINIGNNVLPVQVATITRKAVDKGFDLTKYETNLSSCAKSTPLRVFYTVSMDADYLRYASEEAAKAHDRSQAVGVAMSDMSQKYLTANTSTEFTGGNAKEEHRYTAFYANYFTDNIYKQYPVDPEGDEYNLTTSRGNTALTFSVSPDNQFYRFQKNRVLFMIPGSLGGTTRPAEIDLGSLSDCDPTNYEQLLAALNSARETSGPNGTPSPYWYFGDCVAVDGGDDITEARKTFLEKLGVTSINEVTDGDLKDRYTKFDDTITKRGLNLQPQIDSDNWYYIIREFYYPKFGNNSAGGSTDEVEVHYIAIARKGNEFGSGLSGKDVSMGAMLEWYNVEDGTTKKFDSSKPHYGYPLEGTDGGAIIENPETGGHEHEGNWYVSARPGGLRVGSLANFVGTKGYDIREGVNDPTFEKDINVVTAANVTRQARTYFLPAVSGNSSVGERNAVINIFMGNNGRILVEDTTLAVTERVDNRDGTFDLDDTTEFHYKVILTGVNAGNRKAVWVIWDQTAQTWRRTIGSIDAITNPSGLIYSNEAGSELAKWTGNGTEYDSEDGQDYYIYIDGALGSITRNMYSLVIDETTKEQRITNGAKSTSTKTVTGKDGEGDTQEEIITILADVYLVPVGLYDSYNANAKEIWTLPEDDSIIHVEVNSDGDTPTGGFPVAYLEELYYAETTAFTVSSPYDVDTTYLSKTITFGDVGENSDYATGSVYTEFDLTSGYGLLFNGLGNGVNFRIEKTISNDQFDAGWQFKNVNEQTATGTDGRYQYDLGTTNGTLYVTEGTTGVDESAAHYVDVKRLAGLTVRKSLGSADGTDLNEHDRAQDFTFTIKLTSDADGANLVTAPLSYVIYGPTEEGSEGSSEVKDRGYLYTGSLSEASAGDIQAGDNGWTVTLKDGWYINITNAPENAYYTITEDAAAGYETTNSVSGGTAESEGNSVTGQIPPVDVEEDNKIAVEVNFTNTKQKGELVTLSLTATKEVTSTGENDYYPPLKEGDYSFTITPDSGNPANVENLRSPVWNDDDSDDDHKALITLFEGVEFTEAGTYKFTVQEVEPDTDKVPGITYDKTEYTVTVKVEEDYDENGVYTGNLKATVTVSKDGAEPVPTTAGDDGAYNIGTFVNNFHTDASIELKGSKNIVTPTGSAPAGSKFTFTLEATDGTPMPDKTETEVILGESELIGEFSFDEITYTRSGTYTYTIKETVGDAEGYTYDTTVYTATVTVGVDPDYPGSGLLKATVVYSNASGTSADKAAFTNYYNKPVDLAVSKTVTGSAGNRVENFEFTVTLTAPDGVKLAETYDYELTDPAEGQSATGKVTVGDDGTVTIGNNKISLKHGQTLTIKDLPAGTVYTVEERDYSDKNYATFVNGSDNVRETTGELIEDTTKLQFINANPGGGVLVSKEVTGTGAPKEKFQFTVKLYDRDGVTALSGEYTGKIERFDNKTTEQVKISHESSIYLWHGDILYIEGLPVGAKVTVTEETVPGFVTTVTADGQSAENGVTVEVPNEIDEVAQMASVAFTNAWQSGSLTVSKTVNGEAGETDRDFHFTVTLTAPTTGVTLAKTYEYELTGPAAEQPVTGTVTVNPDDGTVTIDNNKISLKHGQSITILGLPAETTYTVEEDEANEGGYSTTLTNGTGTITDKTTATVEFTNTRGRGDLTVSKTVKSEIDSDKAKDFSFTVTLGDKTITGTYGDMTFANGVATFTLKDDDSKTATGLPAGITYEVTEDEANQGGYSTTVTGEKGSIKAGDEATAAFTNTRDTGDLTVSKTVVSGNESDKKKDFSFTVTLGDKTISGTYADMTFAEGVATFTLKHGESMTATGLPKNITYTVVETAADGYTTSSTGAAGSIEAGKEAKAAFTNTAIGSLTITKTVDNGGHELTGAQKAQKFSFTLTLTIPEGKALPELPKELKPIEGPTQGDNGSYRYTFELSHEGSLTISGLPDGTTYEVTEDKAEGYTTSYTGAKGEISTTANKGATAAFTNTVIAGSLKVSKTVSGNAGDKTKDFTFTVKLDDNTINGTYGEMTFNKGEATFTLKHDQSKTATGLPAGIGYTVTEAEAGKDGYTTTATGEEGSITKDATATAEFTNTKDTGSLTVKKTVTGDGDTTKEFNFTVTLTLRDTSISINGTYGDMTFENGVATFTLKHGQSKTATGLPAGIGYTVTEAEADEDGYTTTATGAKGSIEAGKEAKAEFENGKTVTATPTGSLKVSKTVIGDSDTTKGFTFTVTLSDTSINGKYGDMTFTDGVATFTLKDGESKAAIGLPTGIRYTVTEAEAEGYTTTSTGAAGEIEKGITATAAFTNTRDTGNLTVTKTVEGKDGDRNKEFSFTVTLSDTSISGTYGEMTFNKGVATFTLKHGESKTATGLPAGVTYTVAETASEGYTATATGATGTITKDATVTAAFTNTRDTGDLTVSKTVTGNAGDKTRDFSFTVTLDDTSINGTYGDMTFADGVATFTLKHGESKTATGLPTGIRYTVTEAEAEGYTTTATGETGTISADSTATAAFVNDRTVTTPAPRTGSLTVTKTVTGSAGDTAKEFTFTVTLSNPYISGTYGGMTFTQGVATFTLKDGESKTASRLPAGISYTVTEAEADQDGYTTTATGATGIISANSTAIAAFVNDKTVTPPSGQTGKLTVTKTVTGNEGDTTKDFTFTVTLDDTAISGEYGDMTFANGVATFTLKHGESKSATRLPAGIGYTVTEAEANQDGYTTTATGTSGTISAGGTAIAAFVNDKAATPPATGSLTVSKTVAGNAGERLKEFHFTVALSDESINGTYGDMTFTNGVASFTLRHNRSKTAVGLPTGITYTVSEAEADQNGYVTTVSGSAGTISSDGSAANFTNTRDVAILPGTGNLVVSKIVGGSDGDKTLQFHFAVVLDDDTVNGTYGDMTFVNGMAMFTLKHGESKTAAGLPSGITYSVMEKEANQNGYTTMSSGRDGTIPDQGTAQVYFFNTSGVPGPDDPPTFEFDDPDIPLGDFPDDPDVPVTGDNSHLAFWLALLVMSVIGLLISVFLDNKNRGLFSSKDRRVRK